MVRYDDYKVPTVTLVDPIYYDTVSSINCLSRIFNDVMETVLGVKRRTTDSCYNTGDEEKKEGLEFVHKD